MNPLTTNPFVQACSFLETRVASNNSVIEDKVEKMNQYVDELNAGSTSGTLSEQRKKSLVTRVIKLFNEIEKVYHPVPLPQPGEIYHQQAASLKHLLQVVQQLTPIQFYKELKKQHPDVKAKVYEMVWIASGCPKPNQFSDKTLIIDSIVKNDGSILKREFHSLTGSGPGTLLQQVEADFLYNFQLSQNHPNSDKLIQNKVEFFKVCFEDRRNNHSCVKAIFNCLHPKVKTELNNIGINPPFYGRGINFEAYRTFGAHYNGYNGITTFQVYAPNARKVVLNLTAFDHTQHAIEMNRRSDGIWVAKTDQAKPGRSYHYMITGKNGGDPFKKVDPFAFKNLIHDPDLKRENHESIVVDIDKEYPWTDGAWMCKRANHDFSKQPLNIYEIHSPSWMLSDGKVLNWRELAFRLEEYCRNHGYNAVELMALFSHPQPISMGYQITNFFAPHTEMGSWEDFQFFVDFMHNKEISVFADWVPAHFAIDEFALCDFDGSPIFEDDNLTYALHPEWGTRVFDFKKQFTKDFLGSNADFLLRKIHLDGLRVDAVSSMLFLNYARPPEHPKRYNRKGTEIDLDAKVFLRHLNAHIHREFPGVITMAEEAFGFPNLTTPLGQRGMHVNTKGIGFNNVWQMGWMKDTLEYWKKNAVERKSAFSLLVWSVKGVDGNSDIRPRGKIVLPYSHDENANEKGTILTKMSGNVKAEKFANGRLALAFQSLRGGGPVLDFMTNPILQVDEWHWIVQQNKERKVGEKARSTMQWEKLDPSLNPDEHLFHSGAALCRKDLNELVLKSRGLWDQTDDGFSWIDALDEANCVLSFHRRSGGQQFACIFNTLDSDIESYRIRLPDSSYAPELMNLTHVREVYSTDDVRYGGSGRMNGAVKIIRDDANRPTHFQLRLPPYTAIVLEEYFS